MVNEVPKKTLNNLRDIHHKNLSNPLVVLLGATSIFFVIQIISAFAVIPFKTSINNDNLFSAIYVLVSSLVFMLILSTIKKIVDFRWRAIGWSWPGKKSLLRAMPALFLYILISIILTLIATKLFPNFNAQQAQDVGFQQLKHPVELILAFLALSILTPVIEETIFRGILFKGMRRRLPFWLSAVIASLIFAVAHMQWNVAVDTFALSLILCYLVEKSGSILPSILLHTLKNGLAFAVLFLNQ